jgi:hypothetical protein
MRTLWNKLSPAGRFTMIVCAVAGAAALVVTARRDLARRDPRSIRGNPELWNKVTRLPGGATAYLLAGRKTA